MKKVVAEAVAEQRHGHNREGREALCDVRRCRVSPLQPPVPADHGAAPHQSHAVDRLLKQRGPVVFEGNLRPGRWRQARQQRGDERGGAGCDKGQGRRPAKAHSRAGLATGGDDQDGGCQQRDGVPGPAPAVQGAGQRRPFCRREEVQPRKRQRQRQRRERRPARETSVHQFRFGRRRRTHGHICDQITASAGVRSDRRVLAQCHQANIFVSDRTDRNNFE